MRWLSASWQELVLQLLDAPNEIHLAALRTHPGGFTGHWNQHAVLRLIVRQTAVPRQRHHDPVLAHACAPRLGAHRGNQTRVVEPEQRAERDPAIEDHGWHEPLCQPQSGVFVTEDTVEVLNRERNVHGQLA